MDARELFSEAYRIDQRINSKIEALDYLNNLATKCTATFSDMPKNPNRGNSRLEDTIIKIIELQHEINDEIDKLVDTKREIMLVISQVENHEQQTLLELRYISFKTWEQIAVEMNYGIDNIYKLHKKALASANQILLYSSLQ